MKPFNPPSIAGLLLALAIGSSVRADAPAQADDRCYDWIAAGYIIQAANEVDLNDLLPPTPENVSFGFRADFLVRVRQVVAGRELPRQIWVRAVLTHMLKPTTPILFYIRADKRVPYLVSNLIVRPPRDWLGRFVAPTDPRAPVKCTSAAP